MSHYKVEKDYVRLGQLNNVMVKKELAVMELFLSRNFNINYAIPANSPAYRHSPQWLGYTALHLAVEHDFQAGVNLLLKHGADITLTDYRGFTPLRMLFEKSGLIHKVPLRLPCNKFETLLSAHLITSNKANPTCKSGISHLHIACIMNSMEVVEMFLKAGVDVNQAVHADSDVCPGYTGLHFALKYQHLDLARLLLKHGADFNRKNFIGLTPLHMILKYSIKSIDEKLKMPLQEHWSNRNSETILLIIDDIIKSMKVDIDNFVDIDYVIRSHFHLCCMREQFSEDFENALKTELDVNAAISLESPIFSGYTPLHFAAHFNIEMVLGLLKKGANLLTKNGARSTPLELMITRHKNSDLHKVLQSQLLSPESKLFFDVIPTMNDLSAFREYLQLNYTKNKQLSFESKIWPGYTLLHLAVHLSTDTVHLFRNSNDIVNGRSMKKMKLDRCGIVDECLAFNVNDIIVQDATGRTPLHLAFRLADWEIIEKMLTCHETITSNPVNVQGLSHFHIACAANKPHLIEMLIKANSSDDLNAPVRYSLEFSHRKLGRIRMKSGWTALHVAVAVGAEEAVEALLRCGCGADPGRIDSQGYSPLHLAFGNPTLLGLLLSSAKATAVNPVTTIGLSHLHVACYLPDGNLAAVEALLSIVRDVNEAIGPTDKLAKESRRLEESCCSVYSSLVQRLAGFAGYTALHLAVQNRQLETVNLLLRADADARVRNAAGLSPLHLALTRQDEISQDIVYLLASSLDAKQHWPDHVGMTRLHVACAQRDVNVMPELMDKEEKNHYPRINSDSTFWPGYRAVDFLISIHLNSYAEAVHVPRKHEVDGTLQSTNDLTPAHLKYEIYDPRTQTESRDFNNNPSLRSGYSFFHRFCQVTPDNWLRVAKDYLAYDVINEPVDHFICDEAAGYTPLHYAVRSGKNDLIKLLLQHGADIQAEDVNGNTPLHVAARYCPQSLEVLLKTNQVDIQAKNVLDQTALELALGCSTVTSDDLKVLLKYKAKFNIVNRLSKKGLLAIAVNYYGASKLSALMSDVTDLTDIDENGRNAVHNIVTTCHFRDNNGLRIRSTELIEPIMTLLKCGCDIDHRDNEGITPIHVAVMFKNNVGLKILLQLGADITIRDNTDTTPYYRYFLNYKASLQNVTQHARRVYNEFMMTKVMNFLAMLHTTGLYFITEEEMKIDHLTKQYLNPMKVCLQKLEEVKLIGSFSLYDLFRDKNFMRISTDRYNAIVQLVETLNTAPDYVQKWSGVIMLIYRKMAKRMRFLQPAINKFMDITGFKLPDTSMERIFKYLDSKDLEILASAN